MGEAFTDRQAADIRRAIEHAEAETGMRFSVYVGGGSGEPDFPRRVHAAVGPGAARTVLVYVDPAARVAEVVTGEQTRWLLDDRTCGLAVMSMATAFSVGDLSSGICGAINLLREQARRPPSGYEHQRAPD